MPRQSINKDMKDLSNTKFSIGDYIKTAESLFRSEGFGKIIEEVGQSYKCLVSFVETSSSLGGKPKKILTSKEVMRPEVLIKISEKEYQEGISKQEDSISHSQKLNKYWQDSKSNLTLLGDILKKDSLDRDTFKKIYKELVLVHYDEIFSLDNLNSDRKQEIVKSTIGNRGYAHENMAKCILLTQQFILDDLSKKLNADELEVIKAICIEKQNNQIEFTKGINEGIRKLDYTVKKGIIFILLGLIIVILIPIFAPHLKIGSFIFGPLFTGRGIYILIKAILLRKRR